MAEKARGRYNRLSTEVDVLAISADPDSILRISGGVRSQSSDYKLVGRPGKYLPYTPSSISQRPIEAYRTLSLPPTLRLDDLTIA